MMLEKKGKLLLVFCALFQLSFAESINENEIENMVKQILQNSKQSSTLSANEIANITNIVKQKLKSKEKVNAPSTNTAEETRKQSNALNALLSVSPENTKDTKGTVDTYNKVILEGKHIKSTASSSSSEKPSAFVASLSQEADVRTKEMRHVVVKSGDTLSGIAYAVYGSIVHYTKIYEANDDILRNPDKIYIGQRLRVPE